MHGSDEILEFLFTETRKQIKIDMSEGRGGEEAEGEEGEEREVPLNSIHYYFERPSSLKRNLVI